MPKVTGFNRKRIGHRNHLAKLQSPPTTLDSYNQTPRSGTWTTIVAEWPCELIDVAGGEVFDGFATKSETERVAIGDAYQLDGAGLTQKCRAVINGITYGITAVRDVSGDNFTKRVELRSIKQ